MRPQDHLFCPPLIWMPDVNSHGYLLAWLKHQKTGGWYAVITWTRITGDRPTYRRLVITTQAIGIRPMEDPGTYRNVPRLLLTATGEIQPLSHHAPPPPLRL